jgi:DNA primase
VNDERDEIRARVDIVELVGASVRLERKGKSYLGLCPFHADKKPSFNVSPDTGRYICWSCQEKGDIFTWVMKTQNVEFPEAVRFLAKMAGVTLSERHRGTDTSQREVHHAAMAEAQSFFQEHLVRSELAMAYCTRRGLSKDVLDLWGIGYSPEGGGGLTARLRNKGFPMAECQALFLVDQDAGGGYYDKFRGRLMFPIWNEKSELVAFGGRLLGEGNAKYINSSDTPLYSKSRVLYGMNHARNALQKSNRAVLVEGYLDVIACHRAGVTSALASLGTMMSEQQVKLLKRWVEEVVILYDSDAPGQKAAGRASQMLVSEGLKVRVALMPEGDDPDTLLASKGAAAVQEAVEQGLSPLEYRLQALDRRLSADSDDYWPEVVAILADAPSALELQKHTFRLASRYPGIRDAVRAEKALMRDIQRYRAQRPVEGASELKETPSAKPKPFSLRKEMTSSEIVIFRAFIDERHRDQVWPFASRPEIFLSDLTIRLSEAIRQAFGDDPPSGPPAHWIHRLEPEELQTAIEALVTNGLDEPMSEAFIVDTVQRLQRDMLQRKYNNGLSADLSPAEKRELLNLQRAMKPDSRAKPPAEGLY